MAVFKKKADPISARAQALNAEIAALEAKIKKLDQKLENPALLSPRSAVAALAAVPPSQAARQIPIKGREPVFEEVDAGRLTNAAESLATAQHFNELGVRKYDLIALINKLKKYFHGPSLSNPKLVTYLAAGSVQGLRPLRYEKRISRNRFVAAAILVALVLLGLFVRFFHQR